MAVYSKIVFHPVDLGYVCRGIRRRSYSSLRDVRLDMWRVFANCVKFHSHPHNKEAVPSFVSIALHLREYFNILWQEYMLPSDLPEGSPDFIKLAFSKRAEDRRRRIENSGVLVMSKDFTSKTAAALKELLDRGGCVDKLDHRTVFGPQAVVVDHDSSTVLGNLRSLQSKLEELADSPDEYSLDEFHQDLTDTYTKDVLEGNQQLRNLIRNRLDRFFWKRSIPLHEANSRGVTQSSIWGNVAATIWARESSKKPYWPALCLGILPPEDQREGWHGAVTERNEARLPEKLRAQLLTAKKKCEQAQKRQNLSYFLVEFLGTHEFIWVRETDIIEKFDRAEDPNKAPSSASKKKRASRSTVASVIGSKTYKVALEECEWACEEYEAILQGAFEDEEDMAGDDDEGDLNYNFSVLSQSDDEADETDDHGYNYDEDDLSDTDADEANWLLSHDGMIEIGAITKKKPKKKAPAAKKKLAEKKESVDSAKKAKADVQKKRSRARDEKKEQKEVEKRRKQRTRDREKFLRDEARRQKQKRPDLDGGDDRGLLKDKRARATAIARAYVIRTGKYDADYKSLALNGVMAMPSAMVDPSGLLGMALAFRAASGELTMPDESEDQITKTTKPWAAIDTSGPKTSAERTQNLERKAEMLEKEIQRLHDNAQTRRRLADAIVQERLALDRQIEEDEVRARQSLVVKRKIKKAPAKSPAPSKPKPKEGRKTKAEEVGEGKAVTGATEEEEDEDDVDDVEDDEDEAEATAAVVATSTGDVEAEATVVDADTADGADGDGAGGNGSDDDDDDDNVDPDAQ